MESNSCIFNHSVARFDLCTCVCTTHHSYFTLNHYLRTLGCIVRTGLVLNESDISTYFKFNAYLVGSLATSQQSNNCKNGVFYPPFISLDNTFVV